MLEFKFDAHRLDFSTNQVKIYTLPCLEEKTRQTEKCRVHQVILAHLVQHWINASLFIVMIGKELD